MDDRPIGGFDSGLGGLTVLKGTDGTASLTKILFILAIRQDCLMGPVPGGNHKILNTVLSVFY